MTLEDVAAAAQELDGVRERRVSGRLRWQYDGRLVARQLDATSIVVRTDFGPRERLVARHPETFTVPPRFEAHMMVVVELAHADPAAVRRALAAGRDLQRG